MNIILPSEEAERRVFVVSPTAFTAAYQECLRIALRAYPARLAPMSDQAWAGKRPKALLFGLCVNDTRSSGSQGCGGRAGYADTLRPTAVIEARVARRKSAGPSKPAPVP